MKTTYAIASFLVAGAGAMGAGAALDLAHYAGSDTLLTVTKALITTVPVTASRTWVAVPEPVKRHVQCKTASSFLCPVSSRVEAPPHGQRLRYRIGRPGPLAAEGIVHSLDGLSLVANSTAMTQTARTAPGLQRLKRRWHPRGQRAQPRPSQRRHVCLVGFLCFGSAQHQSDRYVSTDGCSYVTYNKNQTWVPGGSYRFPRLAKRLKGAAGWCGPPYNLLHPEPPAGSQTPTSQSAFRRLQQHVRHRDKHLPCGQDTVSSQPRPFLETQWTARSKRPIRFRWALIANFGSIFEDQQDAFCPTGACKCIHHVLRPR